MKNKPSSSELNLDHLGQHFSSQLTLATTDLPHDISQRLRVARQLAMSMRKPMVQVRLATNVQTNGQGTLTGPSDEGLGLWSILASALPLLALLLGLMAIHGIAQDNFTSEIAAIDSALLTDELPPDAYSDAGFVKFLKQGPGTSTQRD